MLLLMGHCSGSSVACCSSGAGYGTVLRAVQGPVGIVLTSFLVIQYGRIAAVTQSRVPDDPAFTARAPLTLRVTAARFFLAGFGSVLCFRDLDGPRK